MTQVKSLAVQFKTEGDGLKEGEFLVYPSTFTRTPDSYGDVVKAGAFAADIAERAAAGVKLPGLFGHRMDDPDFFVAEMIEEGEDDHGWWVKGRFLLDSPKGRTVYNLVKSGLLRELSFAFDVLDEGAVDLGDGQKANELRALKVYEYSFVPVGANSDTSVVAVKSAAAAVLDGAKAGRVLSAKNQDALRGAIADLQATTSALEGVLAESEPNEDQDEEDSKGEDRKSGKPETESESAKMRRDFAFIALAAHL